jgi:hypothetical protein
MLLEGRTPAGSRYRIAHTSSLAVDQHLPLILGKSKGLSSV